jgi:hypothetical protein
VQREARPSWKRVNMFNRASGPPGPGIPQIMHNPTRLATRNEGIAIRSSVRYASLQASGIFCRWRASLNERTRGATSCVRHFGKSMHCRLAWGTSATSLASVNSRLSDRCAIVYRIVAWKNPTATGSESNRPKSHRLLMVSNEWWVMGYHHRISKTSTAHPFGCGTT